MPIGLISGGGGSGGVGPKGDTGEQGDTGLDGIQGKAFTVTATGSFVESTIFGIESSSLFTSSDPCVYVVTTDERTDKTQPINVVDLGLHAVLYDGVSWSDMGQFTGDEGEKGDAGEKGDPGEGNDVYDGLDSDDTEAVLSAAQGKVLKDIQDSQQVDIDVNNSKVGITTEQIAEIAVNTIKVGITTEQSDAIVLNTDKVGITPEQSAEIVINNAKVGITPEQIAEIAVNNTKVAITPEQAAEIVVNTAKVGITTEQSDNIVLNNAKVGITTDQSDAIDLNTAKVGITPEQVLAVSDNTLVRHSHLNKTVLDKFDEDTGQLTYNGVAVGGGDKGDTGDTGASFAVTESGPISEAKMLDVEANFIAGSYIQVVTSDDRLDPTFRIGVSDLSLRAIKYDGVSWFDMGQFTGSTGEKGDTGETGETGATGMDGIQGMQGNSFTVSSSGSLTESVTSTAE